MNSHDFKEGDLVTYGNDGKVRVLLVIKKYKDNDYDVMIIQHAFGLFGDLIRLNASGLRFFEG